MAARRPREYTVRLESGQSSGGAREGCALLQGIVLCGKCGKNMATTYKKKSTGECTPVYLCNRDQLDYGNALCTRIPGTEVDAIVTATLLEKSHRSRSRRLSQCNKKSANGHQADQLLYRQVERAQYNANLARRRFMAVDPENRIVAQTLAQEWNEKLRLLEQARGDYDNNRQHYDGVLDSAEEGTLSTLAADFAGIWHHPATRYQDEKRMLRLLVEDVTLTRKVNQVEVAIRFKPGNVMQKIFSYSVDEAGDPFGFAGNPVIGGLIGL